MSMQNAVGVRVAKSKKSVEEIRGSYVDQLEIAVLRAQRDWTEAAKHLCPPGGVESPNTALSCVGRHPSQEHYDPRVGAYSRQHVYGAEAPRDARSRPVGVRALGPLGCS